MARPAWLVAAALTIAMPAAAQPTEPHPQSATRWSQEAKRYLTECQVRPGSQSDCLDAQRHFLDVFAKAMDGDTQAQRDTAATLDPPGSGLVDDNGFVRRSRIESCAWRNVVIRFARLLEREDFAWRWETCSRMWREQSTADNRAKEIERTILAAGGGVSSGPRPGPFPAADPAIWVTGPRPLRGLPEYPPPVDCAGLTMPGQPSCAYGLGEAVGRLVARAYICGASRERLRLLADAVHDIIGRLERGRRDAEDARLAYVHACDVDLRRLRYDAPRDCTEMPARIRAAGAQQGLVPSHEVGVPG